MLRGTPKLTSDKNWNGKVIPKKNVFVIAFHVNSLPVGSQDSEVLSVSAHQGFNKSFGTSWTRLTI